MESTTTQKKEAMTAAPAKMRKQHHAKEGWASSTAQKGERGTATLLHLMSLNFDRIHFMSLYFISFQSKGSGSTAERMRTKAEPHTQG